MRPILILRPRPLLCLVLGQRTGRQPPVPNANLVPDRRSAALQPSILSCLQHCFPADVLPLCRMQLFEKVDGKVVPGRGKKRIIEFDFKNMVYPPMKTFRLKNSTLIPKEVHSRDSVYMHDVPFPLARSQAATVVLMGAAWGSRPPVARIAHCRAPILPVELTGLADWDAQLEERVITEVKAHKPGPTGMETLAHIKSMIEGWCAPPDQLAALVAGYPTHMQQAT